jgi:hypothetical protein
MPEWKFHGMRRRGCVNGQDVLGGLWISQVRALVGAIGGDRTLSSIGPFLSGTGTRGAINVRKALGIEGNDFVDVGRASAFVLAFHDEGNLIKVYSNGLQIVDLEPCPFRGAPWELCWLRDHVAYKAFLNTFSPDLEPYFEHDVEDDSTNCILTVTRGSKSPLQGAPLMELTTEQVRESVPLDVLSKFGVEYLSEYVAGTTMAAKQALGEDWRGVLIPAAEHYGVMMNQRITGATRLTGTDLASVGMVVDFVSSLLMQEGREDWVQASDWTREITMCPFSTSSKEICEQLEAMFRGLCCSMNSNLAFFHDKRMTEGHATCQYHISKNGASICAKEEVEPTGALASLKTRLAKGEISEVDYLRLRRIIMD